MKQNHLTGAVVVSIALVFFGPGHKVRADDGELETHVWSEISYPDVQCPWATKIVVPSIEPQVGQETGGLDLMLTFARSDRGKEPKTTGEFVEPEIERIRARLHLRDGQIIAPRNGAPLARALVWTGGGLGSSATLHFVFPWQKNDFAESWIELRFPDQTYWLEVPYGFVRDPTSPLCESERTGKPRFAPAMKSIEKSAKLVNWKYVEYKFKIHERSVTLRQSNPLDAHCEVVLYGFKGWTLFTPRASMLINVSETTKLEGEHIGVWKHEDGLRRSDRFSFSRNLLSDDSRDWGKISVRIADQELTTIVPSSVFKFGHGRGVQQPNSHNGP